MVVIAPAPKAVMKKVVARMEEENWVVIVAKDMDDLFVHIVNPRCFCVFISDKFHADAMLLIKKGREVSNAHWVLTASKLTQDTNLRAVNAGVAAILSEPVNPVQYLLRARQMFSKYKKTHQEEFEKAKVEEAGKRKSVSLGDDFSGQDFSTRIDHNQPLVVMAVPPHSGLPKVVDKLKNEEWSIKWVRDPEELAEWAVKPKCFCVFISETFDADVLNLVNRTSAFSKAFYVLLTAKMTQDVQARAQAAGVEAVLAEPLNPVQYLVRARQLVVKWEKREAAAAAPNPTGRSSGGDGSGSSSPEWKHHTGSGGDSQAPEWNHHDSKDEKAPDWNHHSSKDEKPPGWTNHQSEDEKAAEWNNRKSKDEKAPDWNNHTPGKDPKSPDWSSHQSKDEKKVPKLTADGLDPTQAKPQEPAKDSAKDIAAAAAAAIAKKSAQDTAKDTPGAPISSKEAVATWEQNKDKGSPKVPPGFSFGETEPSKTGTPENPEIKESLPGLGIGVPVTPTEGVPPPARDQTVPAHASVEAQKAFEDVRRAIQSLRNDVPWSTRDWSVDMLPVGSIEKKEGIAGLRRNTMGLVETRAKILEMLAYVCGRIGAMRVTILSLRDAVPPGAKFYLPENAHVLLSSDEKIIINSVIKCHFFPPIQLCFQRRTAVYLEESLPVVINKDRRPSAWLLEGRAEMATAAYPLLTGAEVFAVIFFQFAEKPSPEKKKLLDEAVGYLNCPDEEYRKIDFLSRFYRNTKLIKNEDLTKKAG